MTHVTIWHNPRCSKSRETLALLTAGAHDITIRRYLDDPPSAAEIRDLLALLNIPALGLIRSGEQAFRELGLGTASPEDALIDAMSATPKLIERPVVFANGAAALGRPPEAVQAIL